MYFYYSSVGYLGFLRKCLHASNVMGVRALVTAASNGVNCYTTPTLSNTARTILKEILDNGTSIIAPAGNNANGYPCNNDAFYPLHPSFDDRIIVVSSTGKDDKHFHTAVGASGTHSHFPGVDVCAPGYGLTVALSTKCDTAPPFPYFGYANGTSFASPLVTGVVSLMYSVNKCLSTADVHAIIKSTTDPIVDASNYSGLVGTGRVNAYKAVQKAQSAYSSTVDLYIKDRWDDYGISGGYHWQAKRDDSPDIWCRNQQDGMTNQIHQDPEYQNSSPVYVYVKVRNKSCDTSSSQETLRLYWTKAASWSSWPQNWDGTSPLIGNVIDSIVVPPLLPGKDTILEFTWNILNPYIYSNWSTCLLARIEGSTIDPITVYPGRIDDDVYFNNNIAMKNLTIIDSINGIVPPVINGELYPVGRYMFVGNVNNEPTNFDLEFTEYTENAKGNSLVSEAELKIKTDETGWDILTPYVLQTEGIDIYGEEDYTYIITTNDVELLNVEFPAHTRVSIYVGFNFLVEEAESNSYSYHVQQRLSSTGDLLGGEYFEISRKERNPFYADAGPDQTVQYGNSANLNAAVIQEPAIYRWYEADGSFIEENNSITLTPEETSTYKLEVTSTNDGYVDYDEMEVRVIHNWINSLSPNPATNTVMVDYTINAASTASIMLLNSTATYQQSFTIPPATGTLNINLSNVASGSYSVILIIDGVAEDSETLIIQ
jgi:hypothetical protein